METQHWLGEACDCNYLDDKRAEQLLSELEQIGRMLNSMMEKSHLFCISVPEPITDDR
jgi:four helix bundle protein